MTQPRPSRALWIPAVWLFIAGSRPVSLWLHLQVIGSTGDAQMEGSPIDRNVLTALMVAAVVVLVGRRRKLAMLLKRNMPLVLFLLYCGTSIMWSDFPDVAFKRWLRSAGDIMMVLILATERSPSTSLQALLTWLAGITIPFSILSDLQRGISGKTYHFGLTMNKNMYGMTCFLLSLAMLWYFTQTFRRERYKGRTRQLFLFGGLAAMGAFCVWLSNSGTSLACLGIGTSVIFVCWRMAPRSPLPLHAFVASLVILAIYASILNPNSGIVATMGKDPTLTGRTDIWPVVIGMNPSQWFGAGFESFWLGPRLRALWTIFVWQPNEAHNGYIELYLNLGIAGILLLFTLLITAYRRAVRFVRLGVKEGGLALTYVVVIMVYNLTEAGFRMFSLTWILLLLSMAVASKHISAGATPKTSAAIDSQMDPLQQSWSFPPEFPTRLDRTAGS